MRLVVAAVVLASLFAQPASAAAPVAGAAGIGDSYFPYAGNGGYDVLHYDVNLRYQPATDELVGMTRLTARTTQRLARFNLDFALDVESVTVDGRAAAFARTGAHELVVAPARPTGAGQVMTVIVRYAGVPSTVVVDGRTAWTRAAGGAVAVGEPAVAWWWFPSNDHPRDKATFDVSVRVPDGFEAITNGVPARVPAISPPGWATWSWHTGVPMATYLAFLAIGQYNIQASSAPDGRPVVTAFADGLGDADAGARESVGRTVGIATWASTMFGPYPFDVYGGIVVPAGAAPFSLEAQGRPVYPADAFQFGANDFVVVHELAHQWFGDSVSLTSWRDIWLNEGFATYAEWLWAEHIGLVTAKEVFDVNYGAMPADDPFWSVVIGDPGPDRLLDDAVYTRGAMTLHRLRSTIGDPTFFTILRAWTASHRYGNATTEQFVDLASRLSGRDLRPLFMRWLFEPRRPPADA